MNVLGLSVYYHDSSAALIKDGVLVAAAAEERFSRKKHDSGFPSLAIDFCLQTGGITIDDVDHVVFYEKPFVKFERML
ncbi:MAG: carbamoyltransferase N-terminal domain-containing protein, partial [Planctomycetota bacterium]